MDGLVWMGLDGEATSLHCTPEAVLLGGDETGVTMVWLYVCALERWMECVMRMMDGNWIFSSEMDGEKWCGVYDAQVPCSYIQPYPFPSALEYSSSL